MNIFRLTIITLSFTLLVACGGGGSSGGTTPSANLERLPVFAVASVENARTLVGGDEASSMTPAQIYQNIKSRADSADVLWMSDISVVATDGVAASTSTSPMCIRNACTFSSAEGIPFTQFSLDDVASYPLFANTDLPRFNVDSQVVMNHNGVTMVQGRGAAVEVVVRAGSQTRLDYHSYGGWLTGSVFGAETFTDASTGTPVVWYGSYSFGNDSLSSPTSGSATWMGAMVGTTQIGQVIHGSAEITIDDITRRKGQKISIEFSSIRNLDTGTMIPNMMWNELSLHDEGYFSDRDSILGTFYGTNHEEIGGIFDRNGIIGAFGATRQP